MRPNGPDGGRMTGCVVLQLRLGPFTGSTGVALKKGRRRSKAAASTEHARARRWQFSRRSLALMRFRCLGVSPHPPYSRACHFAPYPALYEIPDGQQGGFGYGKHAPSA